MVGQENKTPTLRWIAARALMLAGLLATAAPADAEGVLLGLGYDRSHDNGTTGA